MNGEEFAQLSVPAQARYILPIRLFLAGIAVRMEFPAETIEDIKMAAAEACAILLTGGSEDAVLHCSILEEQDHSLRIRLNITGVLQPSTPDDISLAILEAMSDSCTLDYQQGICTGISIGFQN